MRRSLRVLLALVVIGALCGFALILFSGGHSSSLPPLPNPNGYDDLVKAGNLISDSAAAPYEMEHETLRNFILTNAESLRLARVGLSRACSVPTAELLTSFTIRVNDFVALRACHALLAKTDLSMSSTKASQ